MLTDKDPFWLLHEDDRATVITEARHLWFRLRQDDPAISYDQCFEALRHVGAVLAEDQRQAGGQVNAPWTPPDDLDPECLALCTALNKLPGIKTIESCCGHNKNAYRVWFIARQLSSLPALLYWFMGCHSGFYNWTIQAETDCAMSPVHFMAEGPIGAFGEAEHIARLIEEYLKEES